MNLLKKKTKRSGKSEKSEGKEESQQNKESEKNQKIITSYEGYQKNKILDLSEISEFSALISLEPPSPDLTLFEMKQLAEKYFKENKYNIEDILEYDDTNKDIQKKYLSLAVNELNKNDKIEKINIILEKIQKCGIILDKNIYENEIEKIRDKKLKKNLEYIDYQSSVVKCLEYIKTLKNNYIKKEVKKYIEEANQKLNLIKIFTFNHESNLGNNNYYFYGIAEQLSLKLEEIFEEYHFGYYIYIIDKFLEYINKDFSKLTKNEIYIFRYLIFLLTDSGSIKNESVFIAIKKFLEGTPINNINKLRESIEYRNNKEQNKIHYSKNHLNFCINLSKENNIQYIIEESFNIDRQNYSGKYVREYGSDIFSEEILSSIKNMNSLEDFEEEIFKNILPNYEYSSYFYKDTKEIILDVLGKLMKSNAAKNFFYENYEIKYNKGIKKIEYHFYKDEVIEEIKKRIEFYPIFDTIEKANTNPIDLTIIVNSIPGKFTIYDQVNYFNKNILQIGRIIVFLVHEIFGHFIRRYYSYITKGIIKMNTKDDDCINTKPEGGFFAEKNFLGYTTESILYLKDALFLFFFDSNMEQYPIIKSGIPITEEILKAIIKNNPKLFYFIADLENEEAEEYNIKIDENKEENKKIRNEKKYEKKRSRSNEDNKKTQKTIGEDKITINQYCNYLNPIRPPFPAIISCGYRKGEVFIEM